MHTLTKPFLALTAQDLMSCDLVLLPQELSLRTAAQWLARDQISGAPVVDETGYCVGVLSATDFLHQAMREGEPEPTHCNLTTSVFHGWQMVDLEILPTDQVRNYMTPNPVTVSPFTPMIELARTMVEGHIHRVIVVNEEMKPVGIVTSTDILAAVAHVNPNTLENLETQWPVAL